MYCIYVKRPTYVEISTTLGVVSNVGFDGHSIPSSLIVFHTSHYSPPLYPTWPMDYLIIFHSAPVYVPYLVVSTPLKKISQLVLLFSIIWENKKCAKPPISSYVLLVFNQFINQSNQQSMNISVKLPPQTNIDPGMRRALDDVPLKICYVHCLC